MGVPAFFSLEKIVVSAGGFAGEFGPLSPAFSWAFALFLGESVFSGGGLFGGFSEVEHLLHGFWVLSGGLSTASLPIFSSFR